MKWKDGADAMKWRILAVAAALGALSASASAQSESPKVEIISNVGKSSEIPEQTRKQIHKALVEENMQRAPKLDIPVQLGAKIPQEIKAYQLPTDIMEMAPQLRGFDYVLVRQEVVFLNPGTRKVVAILTG
ncbi:MAG TPA: DUF1236 domain-containing protein [Xanthobacteraceae bacterium]|nr:DUF1236 domain-containing protein [Xanthobacteraceae bacterium]